MRWFLLLYLAVICPQVDANVGVPPVTGTMFGVVFFLIPIVIVEALLLGKRLDISAKSVILWVAAANLASTAVGIPFAFLERYVEISFLPSRLIGTVGDLVSLVLLIPFFVLSVAIELPILKWARKTLDANAMKTAVILANIGSYLLIAAFLIGRMIKSAIVHGRLIVPFG